MQMAALSELLLVPSIRFIIASQLVIAISPTPPQVFINYTSSTLAIPHRPPSYTTLASFHTFRYYHSNSANKSTPSPSPLVVDSPSCSHRAESVLKLCNSCTQMPPAVLRYGTPPLLEGERSVGELSNSFLPLKLPSMPGHPTGNGGMGALQLDKVVSYSWDDSVKKVT